MVFFLLLFQLVHAQRVEKKTSKVQTNVKCKKKNCDKAHLSFLH